MAHKCGHSGNRILCPKCKEVKARTRHHILPLRHYRKSPTIDLCRSCHDTLERMIPFEKQQTKFYFKVVRQFLA